MNTLHMELGQYSHDIHIGCGIGGGLRELFDLDRKVLIVTDDGVPSEYAEEVASQCRTPVTVRIRQGEGSKSFETLEVLLETMLRHGFDRHDCAAAVGGGVVGDLTGFAAACYMRGIDFYNIPTTVLSQVDSSIGGKTAVNFCGVKNIAGAFHQPRAVAVNIGYLGTLPERQISNGLAEAVKMAATFDPGLFEMFEDGVDRNDQPKLEKIITKSLEIKKAVVEKDEKESGLRKVLNFGHTLGHGIESLGMGLYHGECVALGMIPMCSESVRKRLVPVLKGLELPVTLDFDREKAFEAIKHDKKSLNDGITAVVCEEIGKYKLVKMGLGEISERLASI